MNPTSGNNKRIAKNTLFLYIRTLVIMAITLYTSRVILDVLGVTDYGIYNVVGGVVMMFSLLSGSFSSAISRFVTFELGNDSFHRLKVIFSTSVNIQIILSVIIVILGEIVGIWFLNYKMNIPTERLVAANWVLQCSLITFVINLISIPYNACIIAHERMKVFAYISILEAVLKLSVVYMLYASSFDKLSTYAILLVVVAAIIRLTYGIYCKRQFEECNYQFTYDKSIVREMSGFAGWSFLTNTSYILNTQGINILINLFFGVTINAARGIAIQIEMAVLQLVNNFTVAMNPQITKSYASGNLDYMSMLVCRGAKYSCFLVLMFIVPFILETDTILSIWLNEVPAHTSVFLKLLMISMLPEVLGKTINTAVSATGRIKHYQILTTLLGCQIFSFTWLAFKLGYPASSTYVIYIVVYFILIFVRLYCLKNIVTFPANIFISQVIGRVLLVSVGVIIVPLSIIHYMEPSFLRLIFICIISIPNSICVIYFLGLKQSEKDFFISKIKSYKMKL